MKNSFIKGTSITLAARLSNLAIGIIISILLARLLGPDGRGVYALVALIPALAFAFGNLGIASSSVYFTGKGTYDHGTIAGNNTIINTALSLMAVLFAILFLVLFQDTFFTGVPYHAIVLAVLMIPFHMFMTNSENLLLGQQRFFSYNLMRFLQMLLNLILLLLFVFITSITVFNAVLAYFLSYVVMAIVLHVYLKMIIKKFVFRINWHYIKDTLSYGLKSFFGSIISFLHLRLDQLLISAFLTPIAVGYYAIAVSLTERLWLLSQSASTVVFPKIASEKNEASKKAFTPVICRNILFLTLLGAILLLIVSKYVILLLYSKEFLSAVVPFQILLVGTIFVSGSKILANDIAGRGKPMLNTYVNIFSLILNVTLNIFFIPLYGIAGAAYATTISYTLVFILRSLVYSRISGNTITDIIFIKWSDFKQYKNLFSAIFRPRGDNSKISPTH